MDIDLDEGKTVISPYTSAPINSQPSHLVASNLCQTREITILPSKMFSSSDRCCFDNNNVRRCTIDYSVPPVSEDQLRLWLQNAPQYSTIYVEGDGRYDHLSNSQAKISEGSSLDINLHGDERKEMAGEETIRRKRPRSTDAHNLNERLRRKKINQKMATLQEMIPNSDKKDQASIIDDVIKYIKTLQHLVEMMSTETGHVICRSPTMRHQGLKTPTLTPFQERGDGVSLGFPICVLLPSLIGVAYSTSVQTRCSDSDRRRRDYISISNIALGELAKSLDSKFIQQR
ncbi:transcription factor SPATULA-like isoform X1 [Salvia divinorum]|uniref:Transcription factor SPATULA-like isoform X1 n=1 Tax=Salvia divinorum TaxID=28513 RepID=A0ABD1HQ43_SALDI